MNKIVFVQVWDIMIFKGLKELVLTLIEFQDYIKSYISVLLWILNESSEIGYLINVQNLISGLQGMQTKNLNLLPSSSTKKNFLFLHVYENLELFPVISKLTEYCKIIWNCLRWLNNLSENKKDKTLLVFQVCFRFFE